jgi:oligo-1,6-glucosidase/alpha-glucosidase
MSARELYIYILIMNYFKRIILGASLLLLLFLAIFSYINLRTEEESLPEVVDINANDRDYRQREWWEGTTVYQIYPRSFQDSDGDGIGDIKGIISRLDYIKELGFETIWFSPFFKSPQKDFGYDISDYYHIDPVYGDLFLVDSLIGEIHRRGMRVIFDMVLNHTSDQHPWFQESRSSRNNLKSNWYVWQDGKGDAPPNNWHSALGTPGWNYDPQRGQWYYAAFLPFQPDLNWRNPEVQEAMFNLLRYWLNRDVDGFRLDIFSFIYEDAQFRDNPWTLRYLPSNDFTKVLGQHRVHTMNHPDNITLAQEMRNLLEKYQNPSRFMVGEVFGSHHILKKFLGEESPGLNLIFLFDISQLRWRANFFRKKIRTFEAFYPHPYQPTYVFSNHDRPRSTTQLDNDVTKTKLLALLQFTLRGVPFTYQGEEIGMHTAHIQLERAKDPLPRALIKLIPKFIWNNVPVIFNRDNCRTPMQWNHITNSGFTSQEAAPWLPVQDNADSINVEVQWQNENSLLHTYRKLLHLRNKNLSLKWGNLQLLDKGIPEEVFAYQRMYLKEKIVVYINFSKEQQVISVNGKMLFTVGKFEREATRSTLGGNSGVVLRN